MVPLQSHTCRLHIHSRHPTKEGPLSLPNPKTEALVKVFDYPFINPQHFLTKLLDLFTHLSIFNPLLSRLSILKLAT